MVSKQLRHFYVHTSGASGTNSEAAVRRQLEQRGESSDHVTAVPTDGGQNGEIYDIVAVGFGPSNLALAISVHEHNAGVPASERLTARYLERQAVFGWHRGMLLADATMQISFLKDLATLRNPNSKFTFLTYLHERSRLVDFINHKMLFPSRAEFHDYLEWAAARFADVVEYGTEVIDVRPVVEGDHVRYLDVIARSAGREVVRRARNLVVATGIEPVLPAGMERSERVWHSSELLHRLSQPGPGGVARRFAVIGAGQSSAEVAAHLHQYVAGSQVHALFSRYGYSPADDSAFANGVFDPAAVDHFFAAPEAVKEQFYSYHANTNYSVVDLELIEDLYRRVYSEKVSGRPRLHVHHLTRVVDMMPRPESVLLRYRTMVDELTHELDVDVVVCGTGYRPMDASLALRSATELCKRNGSGQFRVQRDYRVATSANVQCGIYLQGGTEHSHGMSASLLSTAAVRAGEIVASVVDRLATTRCPSSVSVVTA